MKKFPLLDDSEINLDSVPSRHPHVLSQRHQSLGNLPDGAFVVDEEFAKESLPDTLSETHDGSPTTPISHDGLASGNDNTEVTLQADGADGNATVIQLADSGSAVSVNWDNWSAIHLYTHVTGLPMDRGSAYLSLGSDKDFADANEGWYMEVQSSGELFYRVRTGGASQNTGRRAASVGPTPEVVGYSIEEDAAGNGHRVTWSVNGDPLDEWNEAQGWPSATDMTAQIGIRVTDAVTRTASFDRLMVILVP